MKDQHDNLTIDWLEQNKNTGDLNELALFAGAGGGILGSHLLGWNTVCAVERDAYAAQVLAQRQNDGILPPFPIWSDVCSFNGKPWRGIVDVISGGFPCQDISIAGKGQGLDGARSGLWSEFARIIREVEPTYAFIENSPMLITRGLDRILCDLAKMGFDAEWGIISCANTGGAHKRERTWIVATNTRRKRGKRLKQKQIQRFSGLPWGKDIRSIEDLRRRPDLPQPLVRRINHDVAFGMDRLKAIGNGQVPVVAKSAFEYLGGAA
ncbi:DNA cytosine methyltransferase [Acinetobacter tianfuensis]|uniref:DNA (cytosine-5-)-methyltransferase n=1 Tax=Acinetobacter tianfuensis TaxID=2419603 RepID=A0A3A8EEI2_9GAMM|nr:DNA cytosine methyltransferase [Acinetobacter tianfuensis]